jgi:hypothetical protein
MNDELVLDVVRYGRSMVVVQKETSDEIRSAAPGGEGPASKSWANVPHRLPGHDVFGNKAGHVVAPKDRKPIITKWTGNADWINQPPSYNALFEQYYDYTHSLIRTLNIKKDVSDIAQDIMLRFMERDALGEFRADFPIRFGTGRIKFRSYYSRFVTTYARGKHRNATRHSDGHQLIVDAPVDDEGTTWYASTYPSYEDSSFLGFDELVASLRRRVVDERLVDAVLGLLDLDRPIRRADLRRAMGVSPNRAQLGLDKVRAALRDVLAETGRTVT